MTPQQWQDFKQALLLAAHIAAPNGKVQAAFAKLPAELEADHREEDAPYDKLARNLVGALYDGLAYGNWIGQI